MRVRDVVAHLRQYISIQLNDSHPDELASEPVKELQQLTVMAETAPSIISSDKPVHDAFREADAGYTKIDTPEALYRTYLVDSFVWSSTDAHGVRLLDIDFPVALCSIPNIAAKLSEYRFMTADVEVEVKMNTTSFHFGALSLVFHPRVTIGSSFFTNRLNYGLMDNDPTIVSASGANTAKVTLRRVPVSTYDVVGTPGSIGVFSAFVLAPLSMTGSTASPAPVTVNVFARFVNIHLAGFGESSSASSVAEVFSRYSYHSKRSKNSQQNEAREKASSGVISTLLSAAGALTPVLAATPLAEIAPFTAIAGTLAPVFASLGLSKPITSASRVPTLDMPILGQFKGSGVFDGTRFSVFQDSLLGSVDDGIMGRPDIRDLVQIPSLVSYTIMPGTHAYQSEILRFPILPTLCRNMTGTYWFPSNAAYYSQFFSYWRGSMKYHFKFFTSAYTTARIRLTHIPHGGPPANIEDFGGDYFSTVIDIRGDTEYSLSVPYMSDVPWTPVVGFRHSQTSAFTSEDDCDYISITCVNPTTTSDETGDKSIYVMVWAAMGEDADFNLYSGFHIRPAENELPPAIEYEKHSLKEVFKGPMPSLAPAWAARDYGFVKAEQATNVCDLAHIMSRCAYNVYEPGAVDSNLGALVGNFMFWRGSYRYMRIAAANQHVIVARNVTLSAAMTGRTNLLAPAFLSGNTGDKYINAVEIPYLYPTVIRPTYPVLPSDVMTAPWRLSDTYGATNPTYHSVGDDYQCGYPIPPLHWIIPNYTPASRKNAGTTSAASGTEDVTRVTYKLGTA